ncbi:E1.6.2.2 [Acanthosepion pharaonis]|uniref:NADH-cytochrome b5 reductase n=1 Tax=Acanthosepion pharaonis TaxID=158019 RepID=A0A812EAB7_ACAPH|nr:E1.6.2.2 [Sepia pharaonis]
MFFFLSLSSLLHFQSLNIQAGQHIILRAYIKGKAINRQYTPINLICSKGYFELLIKIYPDGVMSQYLQTMKPGIEVEFRGPFGQFSMQQIVKFPRLFLLAAGTGIAPLSCVIESILDNEDDETFVHLLFACRYYGDILMKEELHDWLDFWNFSSLCCLSQDHSESVGFCKEPLHFGRITLDLLKTEIKDLCNTYFLICGSNSFNKDMVNFLLELQVPESQYFIF